MRKYIIMQNADRTICLEEDANTLIKRYRQKGYQIIGRIRCFNNTIDMKSIGTAKGGGGKCG